METWVVFVPRVKLVIYTSTYGTFVPSIGDDFLIELLEDLSGAAGASDYSPKGIKICKTIYFAPGRPSQTPCRSFRFNANKNAGKIWRVKILECKNSRLQKISTAKNFANEITRL